MPVIILKFKDNVLKKYHIDKKMSLSIGRRTANDIVIDNLGVSGQHAKIESVADYFVIADMQSKNGTFVNDTQIKSHHLQNGDKIYIGKHELIFEDIEIEKTVEIDEEVSADDTMVLDTMQYRDMMKGPETEDHPASIPQPESDLGVLTFLTGGNQGNYELNKKLVKIGKDASSDIVAGGFLTGGTSATISKRPNGYTLGYVSGISKPKVNKQSVKDTVELKEFDMIEIGSLKMQFVYKNQS